MKQKNKEYLAGFCLMLLLSGLVSSDESSSSSSSLASSSSSSSTESSVASTSSSESSSSESSSSVLQSTSSSQVSSSSSSSSSAPTTTTLWGGSINITLDSIISLLPRFGDLLTGVGDHLIWPVVYILIILGVAGIILSLFGMITSIVLAVVLAVKVFGVNLGRRR